MIPLSLAKLAWIVGAKPKWVLNAAARLGQPLDYTASQARWLRLVRTLNRDLRIPLPKAAELARHALDQLPGRRTVNLFDARADGLRLTLDANRNAATFDALLAAADVFAVGKQAGRKRPPPRHAGAALARAWRVRISVGLLRAYSRRPPAERTAELPGVEILQALLVHHVRFVMVASCAEFVHGASTCDNSLEICYDDALPNLRRLAVVLRKIEARPRFESKSSPADDRSRAWLADTTALRGDGLALVTRHGALDLQRRLPGVGSFAAALEQASPTAAFGGHVWVLSLSALIAVRRTRRTRDDMARLPVIETLQAIPALEDKRGSFLRAREALSFVSPNTHDRA